MTVKRLLPVIALFRFNYIFGNEIQRHTHHDNLTTVSPMGNRESEGAMSCELTRHHPLVSPECRVSSQDGFSRGNPIDRTEFAVDVDIFTTLLCFFDLVNLWHWQTFSFQLLHGIGQNFKIL